MRLKDYIKEIIRPNRDVQQQRGGEVAKAIFTPSAPQELQDRGSEENVWLLNSQPLRVRIGDDNEEIEVMPAWVMYENADDTRSYEAERAVEKRIEKMERKARKNPKLFKDRKFQKQLKDLKNRNESSVNEIKKYKIGDKVRYESDRTKKVRTATIKKIRSDGKLELSTGYVAHPNSLEEKAPPGREKQVKKLKKKFKDNGSAYAIAWAQHNKHGEPKNETIINAILNKLIGNIPIKEYSNTPSPDFFSYQPQDYTNPAQAFIDFKNTSKDVLQNKETDIQTAKQFLRDIWKSGNHDISTKEFIKYLVKKGITVKNRRHSRIAGLEVVEK